MRSSLLLRQVRLVPLDGGAVADPVDVLIAGGGIAAVGSLERPSRAIPVIDGGGRWLIPGLWDAHVHLGQWALANRRLDLSRAGSPEEALALAAQDARRGRPVIGMGMRAGTWARLATVSELDAVCPNQPVVLINSDCHHAWLNTSALDALGLARRDTTVAETEWFGAYPRVAAFEGAPTAADYRAALHAVAVQGIVGINDFEFGAPWEDWASRWHDGCDLLRIRWSPYADQLDRVRAAGLRTGSPLLADDGSDIGGGAATLTVGSLKIISDGSLGTRTAWCHAPYADTDGHGAPNHGAPNQSPGDLAGLIAAGHRAGLTIATHAIGDRALEAALAGYAATGAAGSIEHAQLSTAGAVAELARLGLTASMQPAHLLDDRQSMDRVWPDRTAHCFALRSMLDHGVTLALGSDAPVAPLDPWLTIAAAVHRGTPEWHPEQAITIAEAIAASVDGRRIVAGQPGDIALLDADPLTSDAPTLRAMPVALTAVAGRITHTTL